MTNMDFDCVLTSLTEQLAAIEHERWSHWQKYLHGKCIANPDGTLTIPKDLVEKWSRQAAMPYADLGDAEKDSDREQVRRYLPVIADAVRSTR